MTTQATANLPVNSFIDKLPLPAFFREGDAAQRNLLLGIGLAVLSNVYLGYSMCIAVGLPPYLARKFLYGECLLCGQP